MTTKQRYAEKRLIHLSKEQEEKYAAQSAQKIQAFVGEAAKIQSARYEIMVSLLVAHVTKQGISDVGPDDVEKCRKVAHAAVLADSRQKFSDLKTLFVELGVPSPQPHLEWAAKQAGVTLFDEPVHEEESLIVRPAEVALEKVIQ